MHRKTKQKNVKKINENYFASKLILILLEKLSIHMSKNFENVLNTIYKII